MPNEEDVGPDSLRRVSLIKDEFPAVLSQRRRFRQGGVTGVSPGNSSIVVGRASRKVMREGAVRVMAVGAGGRTLLVPGGTTCGGVFMAPAGKTPKTKSRRRQVKGVHGVLPDREEIVREGVNEDTMQIRYHGRGLTSRESYRWSDEGGEPGEMPTWGAGWRTTWLAQTRRGGTHWQ